MFKWLTWTPFKLYAIDADTGQPIDPNVRMKRYVQYYEAGKSNSGKAVIVAKRRPRTEGIPKVEEKPVEDEKPKDECPCKQAKEGCPCKEAKDGCPCKNHAKAKEAQKVKDTAAAKTKEAEKKKDGENGNKADFVNFFNVSRTEWTTEQDEMLKRMKKLDNSWKDIGAALQCSPGSCKKRFNELDKDTAPEKKEEAKKEEVVKKDGNANKKDKQKGKQAEQAEQKAKAEEKPETAAVIELPEDDVFSYKELELLVQLYEKDFSQSWLRLASDFYDRTGRRVHPDDIRDKFAEMGG